MATSTKLAGAGADDAAVGTVEWANPDRVTADDGSYSTAVGANAANTHYLKATNPGADTVPAGATIDGIVVNAQMKNSNSSVCAFALVSIVKGGVVGAQDRSADAAGFLTTSDAVYTFGGATELWGETWTAADINAADFGVVISLQLDLDSDGSTTISVDYVEFVIHYTAAAATGSTRMTLLGVG